MTWKCEWCNKQTVNLKEITILSTSPFSSKRREILYFVCPEHETKLRRFYDQVRRYGLVFLGLITLTILGLLIPGIYSDNSWSPYVFIMSFVSMGLVLIIFPYCTPQTVEMAGVAKSILIARIIGGMIFALGIIAFFVGLFNE